MKVDSFLPHQQALLAVNDESFFTQDTSRIVKLIRLRWVALFAQIITLLFTQWGLDVDLPLLELGSCVLILGVSNLLLSYFRYPYRQLIGPTILFDVILLTTLLALSGGPTNPFSVLYLIQVLLAAVLSSSRWTWLIAICSSAGFALIFWFHLPLPSALGGHGHHHSSFSLHLQGMWLAYTISALAIGLFVSKLSTELVKERERRLKGEKLLGLAALAAGAAHEIRNPLGTIRIVTSDLESALVDKHHTQDLLPDLNLINEEVDRVSTVLDRLTESAGELRGEPIIPMKAAHFFKELQTRLNNNQYTQFQVSNLIPDLSWPQEAVSHALIQLIRNALQASTAEQMVTIDVKAQGQGVQVVIIDHGLGMNQEVLKHYGSPFFTTRGQQGMGLGVFIAKSVIERLNGELTVKSSEEQGTQVSVWLPVQVFVKASSND